MKPTKRHRTDKFTPAPPDAEWISRRQAAHYCQCSDQLIDKLVKNNPLIRLRWLTPRCVRINFPDLKKFDPKKVQS
jgi:hypothetical protein